ncbi:hypothetical protein D3C85_853970 [compost metagenome]
MSDVSDMRDENEQLRKNAERYKFLRRLGSQKFHELRLENIRTGEPFDSLVDKAIAGQL